MDNKMPLKSLWFCGIMGEEHEVYEDPSWVGPWPCPLGFDSDGWRNRIELRPIRLHKVHIYLTTDTN